MPLRLATACLLFIMSSVASAGPPTPAQALATPVRTNFDDTPLIEVIADYARQVGLDIVFDENSAHDEGITPNESITLQLNGQLPLHAAAELLLDDLGLALVPNRSNTVLRCVGMSEAEDLTTTRAYDISDLWRFDAKTPVLQIPSESNPAGIGCFSVGDGSVPEPVLPDPTASPESASSQPQPIDPFVVMLAAHLFRDGAPDEFDLSTVTSSDRAALLVTADHDTHEKLTSLLAEMRVALDLSSPMTTPQPTSQPGGATERPDAKSMGAKTKSAKSKGKRKKQSHASRGPRRQRR